MRTIEFIIHWMLNNIIYVFDDFANINYNINCDTWTQAAITYAWPIKYVYAALLKNLILKANLRDRLKKN